ncbi:MAG: hypothetical protein J0H10_11615 [Alphaproteobacteria bacterium]|nr:hypothetical protein [Alphaproteobacteria bacterium]
MTQTPLLTTAETIQLSGRPLLITDADEVLFRFVDGFMTFLEQRDLYLDLSSYRLHGNVKQRQGDLAVPNRDVTELLNAFRHELDSLVAVGGARDSVNRLSGQMDVVILSNVSDAQAGARLRNLAAEGFAFPLIPNAGAKGPAVKVLAEKAGSPTFFIDDIPSHIDSVAVEAPAVTCIHFVGDERLKPLLPKAEKAQLRADDWAEIERFITGKLS